MSFYLDTSILVALWIAEAGTERAETWLRSVLGDVFVSDLADAEFRAAISRLVRMNALTDMQADELHRNFDRWKNDVAQPLETPSVDVRRAAHLVRTPLPKLHAPDAIHLATCARLRLTLVSYDSDLLQIAGREGVTTLNLA